MRRAITRFGLPGLVALTLLCIGASCWAQDTSSAQEASQSQVTQPPSGGVNWKGVGLGAGAVAGNLLYVPAKLVYGILGGLGGAAGYALTGGNTEVANSIWRSSLGGDYVLTPDMVSGQKPIYFSGPSNPGTTPAATPASSLPANGATSASLAAPAAETGSPAANSATALENSPASGPLDNGAGPVGTTGGARSTPYAGSSNPNYSYSGYSHSQAPKRSHLTDTSIE